VDVEPVEERPAQPRSVRRHTLHGARTPRGPVASVAARARIHRAHDERSRGERRLCLRPRDRDDAIFERLAERLERAAPELRELVEEEDAVVGEADLAGSWRVSASNEPDLADRVMRRAKGATRGEREACVRASFFRRRVARS
jgi:hypothetical protein